MKLFLIMGQQELMFFKDFPIFSSKGHFLSRAELFGQFWWRVLSGIFE